jgi:TolB-like protein
MISARTAWRRSAALLAVTLLAGCAAGPRLYVNTQADLTYYKKIAVLPFRNLTNERFAGERVTRAFLTELVMTEHYEIVDQNEFAAVLDKIGGNPGFEGIYDPAKVKEAASQIQATGILRGSVSEYSVQRSGTSETPVVAFDAELIDVATNNVVWRGSVVRRGKNRVPIFGGGQRTHAQLIQDATHDLVGRIEREAF